MSENVENVDTGVTIPQNDTVDVNTETDVNTITDTTSKPTLRIKYNHEEKEISYDEAVELAQKGMNYSKVQEKLNELENSPSLGFVKNQADKYDMTIPEYLEAAKAQEAQDKIDNEQAEVDRLVAENVPEAYAREMQENKKFRNRIEAEESVRMDQVARTSEYNDLVEAFPDIDAEKIPQSVWEATENGTPIKYAYMEFKMNEMNKSNKAKELNESNSNSTTGSVTGNGSVNSTHYTRDQVEAMSTDEIKKNYKAVMDSYKQWK